MALMGSTPEVRQSFDVLVVRYASRCHSAHGASHSASSPPAAVTVRLPPNQLASLDAWIARQSDPKPTRPEAIRRALEAVMRLGGLDHEIQ